jgi:hypothetical protein
VLRVNRYRHQPKVCRGRKGRLESGHALTQQGAFLDTAGKNKIRDPYFPQQIPFRDDFPTALLQGKLWHTAKGAQVILGGIPGRLSL